jgi:hypothetical protein
MARERPQSVLDRMVLAVELVRQRLDRATRALRAASVPYALAGGNAVAAWVATIDAGAVRNTQDVDILIGREDFARARAALESAGFVYRHALKLDMFLDGPEGSPRQGVHLLFANEFVKAGEALPNPDVSASRDLGGVRVIELEALVRIKLTAFRDKDRTHLRDMIELGMVDGSWLDGLPAILADRLRALLETPEG